MTSSVLDRHAVVLGASIAGLLTARVLADSFGQVTVVERDELPSGIAPRRGVPQGRQVHALLARGRQILDQLFPDLIEKMAADGAITADGAARMRFVLGGHRFARSVSDAVDVFASRLLLEHHLREAVRALPGVTYLDRHDVLHPVLDETRAVAVAIRSRETGTERSLPADVVVDATGRGSRTPVWLAEAGRTAPEEERIVVDVGYTTGRFRLRRDALDGDVAALLGTCPGHPRAGSVLAVEGGEHMVCLAGTLGDHPPTELTAFVEYAATLVAPDVHDALRDAELLEPLQSARFPANVRRRYERLTDLPERFFVVGDALCGFNPIYGQGMTVAAIEADVLRRQLGRGRIPTAREYFAAAAKAIGPAWDLTIATDLQDPRVDGPRTAGGRWIDSYVDRLMAAATGSPDLARAFLSVAGLLEPPQALMRPDRVARTLWATRRRARSGRVGAGRAG